MSLEQAVRGETTEVVGRLRGEDKIGSLEVGKYADLVVLDKNPFDVDPIQISSIDMLMTMMNARFTRQADRAKLANRMLLNRSAAYVFWFLPFSLRRAAQVANNRSLIVHSFIESGVRSYFTIPSVKVVSEMWERRFPAIIHILIGALVLTTLAFPVFAQEVTHVPPAVFEPGSVGLGGGIRLQDSPYKGTTGDKTRVSLIPLYLLETKYVFGYGTYGGIHLLNTDKFQLDVLAQYRFDYLDPNDSVFLRGMVGKKQSVDAGVLFTYKTKFGDLSIKWVHDILNRSNGHETTLTYGFNWFVDRLLIRPSIGVSWLSSKLSDYYYGVTPTEATPTRSAYRPGTATNILLSIESSYFITPRLLAFADWTVRNFDSAISDSPIVGENLQNNLYFGAGYVFGSYKKFDETGKPERTPTYLRFGGGWGSKCNMMSIIFSGCWTADPDRTSILNFQIGKPLVEKFLDWPLDFVAKLGMNRHLENGKQADFNSYTASVKAYFYGFPWREYLMTRIGLGFGLSYAERIPITEQTSLAEKGKNTSHLLNYMDPSIDVSVGDIIRYEPLRNTFFGFAVSHRSGIFGTSDILGNVDGGSNYMVMYLEAVL